MAEPSWAWLVREERSQLPAEQVPAPPELPLFLLLSEQELPLSLRQGMVGEEVLSHSAEGQSRRRLEQGSWELTPPASDPPAKLLGTCSHEYPHLEFAWEPPPPGSCLSPGLGGVVITLGHKQTRFKSLLRHLLPVTLNEPLGFPESQLPRCRAQLKFPHPKLIVGIKCQGCPRHRGDWRRRLGNYSLRANSLRPDHVKEVFTGIPSYDYNSQPSDRSQGRNRQPLHPDGVTQAPRG